MYIYVACKDMSCNIFEIIAKKTVEQTDKQTKTKQKNKNKSIKQERNVWTANSWAIF